MAVFLAITFSAGLCGVVALATARPWPILLSVICYVAFLLSLRFLLRCGKCHRSVLWWSARHSEGREFLSALRTIAACPYCGYDGAESEDNS
jgi:hypothetical protein